MVLVALPAVISGCRLYSDITVENPCNEPRRVETFDYPPQEIADHTPNRSVTVPAHASVEIKNAYGHTREDLWSLRVVDYGPIPVGPDDEAITLPEDACD